MVLGKCTAPPFACSAAKRLLSTDAHCQAKETKDALPFSYGLAAVIVTAALTVAAAEAAAFVSKTDVAAAAALATAFQAIADGLQHVAALGIATAAGDGAAVLRALAFAFTAAEVEVANLNAIAHTAAGTIALAKGFAQNLQVSRFHRVIATTTDAEAAHDLFKREFARRRVLNVDFRRPQGQLHVGLFGEPNNYVTSH